MGHRSISFVRCIAFLFTGQIGISLGQADRHTVVEGDSLTVTCHGLPGQDLFWSRDRPEVCYEEGAILSLDNVNRSQAGIYTCYARDTYVNDTVETVELDVLYPARIVTWAVTPSRVLGNQTFSITCGMEGNPSPHWEIRHNIFPTSVVYRGDGEATITVPHLPVTCGDFGHWQCTGYNALVSKGINVTKFVNHTQFWCPPRPSTLMGDPGGSRYVITATPDTDKPKFAMEAVGYPYPNFTWSRDDGLPLPTTWKQRDNHLASKLLNTDAQSTSELLMSDLKTRDFSTKYTLTMTNVLGSYQAHYSLCGPPGTPTDLKASNVTQNGVFLTWISGFDMGFRQQFVVYKNDSIPVSYPVIDSSLNHGVGDKWSYMITGLEPNTQYTYSVQAENKCLKSDFSHSVTVTTLAAVSTPTITTTIAPHPDGVFHQGGMATTTIALIVGGSVGGFLIIAGVILALLRYGRHTRMGIVDYPRSKF